MLQHCITAILCKAPVPGYAKSRLIPTLGARGAAAAHAKLATHTVQQACTCTESSVEVWCSPDSEHAFFSTLQMQYPLVLRQQSQGDIGIRMADIAADVLTRARFVLLIGTDCPALDSDYLKTAIEALSKGSDAVIGPVNDGGYILLGLSRFSACLFHDVPWSTSNVLAATRQRLKMLGWRWQELSVLQDIDTPADIKQWPQYCTLEDT